MPNLFETLGVAEGPILKSREVIDPTVDTPDGDGFYGYREKPYGRPEQLAPRQEAEGGFLFFRNDAPPEFTDSLVALAGLAGTQDRPRNQYAVQALDAPEGMEAELGYLRKLVIADRFALRFLYQTISSREYDTMPAQPVDIAGLVREFIADERKKYGIGFGVSGLAGKFGGEGHYAQEELSFGFSIENRYNGVVSVWSRAWLVTK
jgi:hypothetical protein